MEVVFHEYLYSDEVMEVDVEKSDDAHVENQHPTDNTESVVDEIFLLQPQRKTVCCSPYGAIFLGLVYVVICFLFAQPNADCANNGESECEESFWSSAFALDFFICAVSIVLTIHLWLVGRNETVCLAFACLAFGFLVRGVLIKDGTEKGYAFVHSHREFYIATLAYYVLWTISAAFFQMLTVEAWQRLVNKPGSCGALESRLVLVFLIFSTTIVVIGGILGALDSATDMILNIGRIAWHVAYFVFFLGGSIVWTKLASEQTVKIWGLPNSYAGKLLTVSLVLTCVSWIVEISWEDMTGSSCFVLLAYFGILMTVFFTHNVILSVVCPFEIFVDKDEMSQIMSEQIQGRDIVSNLEKPASRNPIREQEARTKGLVDDEIPDTESSSYADSDFGDAGATYAGPTSKPRNHFFFFSIFRAKNSALKSNSSPKTTISTLQQDAPFQQTTAELIKHQETKPMASNELEQLMNDGYGECLVSNNKQQAQILFEKFSAESSVSSHGAMKKVAYAPTCGVFGWVPPCQAATVNVDPSTANDRKKKELVNQLGSDKKHEIEKGTETGFDSDLWNGGFYTWISSLLPANLLFDHRMQSNNDYSCSASRASTGIGPELNERVIREMEERLGDIENDTKQLKKSQDSVIIPEVLTIDKSSIHEDSLSVVSQLTEPIAGTKRKDLFDSKSILTTRELKQRSTLAVRSETTDTPSKPHSKTDRLGKYKAMLKQTYVSTKAQSQMTKGSSEDSLVTRIDSADIPYPHSNVATQASDEPVDGFEISSKDHATLLNDTQNNNGSGTIVALAALQQNKIITMQSLWPKKKSKKGRSIAQEHHDKRVSPAERSQQEQQHLATSTSNALKSLSHLEDQSSHDIKTLSECAESQGMQHTIPILECIETKQTEKPKSTTSHKQSTVRQDMSCREESDHVRAFSSQEEKIVVTEEDFSSNDKVSVSLLDNLSVHMYMTETEDDEEEEAGALLLRKQKDVEQPPMDEELCQMQNANKTLDSTILDEIESSGSLETHVLVECKTKDLNSKNLQANLSLLQTESESDHSSLASSGGASSVINSSASAESDDFLNKMLTTLMASTSEDTNTTGSCFSKSISEDSSGSERGNGALVGKVQANCVDDNKPVSRFPDEATSAELEGSTTEERAGVVLAVHSTMKANVSTSKLKEFKVFDEGCTVELLAKQVVDSGDIAGTAERLLERAPPVESLTEKKQMLYLIHLPSQKSKCGEDESRASKEDPILLLAKSSSGSKKSSKHDVKSNSCSDVEQANHSAFLEEELDRIVEAMSQSSLDESNTPSDSNIGYKANNPRKNTMPQQANSQPRRRRSSRKQLRKSTSNLSTILSTIEESEDESGVAARAESLTKPNAEV